MCAVAVLEAKFVNIAERSPVDVGKIPLQRFRLVRITCAASVLSPVHSQSESFAYPFKPKSSHFRTELYNLLSSVYERWQLSLLPFYLIFPCSSMCLCVWRARKRSTVFSMWQITFLQWCNGDNLLCLLFSSSLVFNLLCWLLSSTEMLQDMWSIPVMKLFSRKATVLNCFNSSVLRRKWLLCIRIADNILFLQLPSRVIESLLVVTEF